MYLRNARLRPHERQIFLVKTFISKTGGAFEAPHKGTDNTLARHIASVYQFASHAESVTNSNRDNPYFKQPLDRQVPQPAPGHPE